jgi:hypothetical protein
MTSTDALHATIDAVRDQYARRDVKSQAGPFAQTGEPTNGLPTLLWPDQKHLIPDRCPRPHCGSKALETNQPYGALIRGDVSCMLCSRAIVNLKGAGTRPIPKASDTSCIDCGERERYDGRRTCVRCTERRRVARLLAQEQMPKCVTCHDRPRTIKHNRCGSCRYTASLAAQKSAVPR